MVGLAGCAVLGIIVAEYWTVAGDWILGVLILLAALLLWRLRSTAALLIFTSAVFSALHLLECRLSPGLLLSRAISAQGCTASPRGIVSEEPEPRGSGRMGDLWRFKMKVEQIALRGKDCPEGRGSLVLVGWIGKAPAQGDLVEFVAQGSNLNLPRNPGEFDQPAYYNRLGIYSELKVRYPGDAKIISSGHGNLLALMASWSRHWMQEQLKLDLADSPEIAGLIQSLVLGLKNETPESTRELFQRTGTMHLFVVNGLHVGLFATIAWHLLKPVGLNRRRAVFVIVPLLGFYALVTGLSPGSVRATLMAAVVFGGHLADRKPISLNSLAGAGFAILLWDTRQLSMPGFQFSFGVVCAILLLSPIFRRRLMRLGQPDLFLPRLLWSRRQIVTAGFGQSVAGLAAVSLAAWIGSAPFTLWYLHLLSPAAVIANLFTVPAAFVILGQGVLSMVLGIFSVGAAALFTNANWAAAQFLLKVVQLFAMVPGGHFYLGNPFQAQSAMEITVFDFGRGGAIHLRSEGRDWLLDTGSGSNFKWVVRNYLHSRGINSLDGLVLSHGRTASLGGALEAIDEFRPATIIDSPLRDRSGIRKTIHEGLVQRGIQKSILSSGDAIQISPSASIQVLFPPLGLETRSTDNRSLVLLLEFKREADPIRVLFVFDSGYPTEQWLLEHGTDLKCDLLIKGMHADEISGTAPFLAAASPHAIICGSGGSGGFSRISEEWVSRVTGTGTELFRQDRTGAVRVEVDENGLKATPFLKPL